SREQFPHCSLHASSAPSCPLCEAKPITPGTHSQHYPDHLRNQQEQEAEEHADAGLLALARGVVALHGNSPSWWSAARSSVLSTTGPCSSLPAVFAAIVVMTV